jgi:hypothetical protein
MTKKKSATKKSATKKSTTQKPTAKKSTAKKTTATKSIGKKLSTKRSTLTFLTESLAAFTVGRLKKTRIQASGGTPPYSFGQTQGSSLPAGLGLNYQGTLWGTPTQAGDTTIFVKVIDLIGGHLTQAFDLQVTSPSRR